MKTKISQGQSVLLVEDYELDIVGTIPLLVDANNPES